MNRVRLRAKLVALGELRYTPAGLAVLQASLRYQGAVTEAGAERQLDFEVAALAVGDAAQRLGHQALGTELDLEGFLAPRRRRSPTLVLHITEFKAI